MKPVGTWNGYRQPSFIDPAASRIPMLEESVEPLPGFTRDNFHDRVGYFNIPTNNEVPVLHLPVFPVIEIIGMTNKSKVIEAALHLFSCLHPLELGKRGD